MSAFLLLMFILSASAGCAFRNYIDPSFGTIQYEDLARPEVPLRLKVFCDDIARDKIVRILYRSGLVRSSFDGEDGSIHITGFGQISPGAYERGGAGLHGTQTLAIVVAITTEGRTVTRQYEHAVLWYSPRAQEPAGLSEPLGYEAYDLVGEQMILRALRDFQLDGVLPGKSAAAGPMD
jgi:hypothetical protein